ncbi:alpha-hydroxy-acid oxidizing protein [Dellaglioa algida]|uniref:alpha-hydroxy-acid oxidizing protein n=1 Tax=Dellaglioa algida TaxID=105612 RepID=UPI0024C4DB39|nr:alpha-hydroxy-acid oxidizing protein [Dellaglioa algida]MDK1726651.1 alpha-hydroxy-acid oxidizing protein [Dellaglioa algida]
MAEYIASDLEKDITIINTFDLETDAEKVIPKGGFGYISSGAGDLYTLEENIRSFNHKLIKPRVLQEIDNPDIKTSIFGDEITSPIIMAPVAAHGLAHVKGEIDSAKGVSDYGSIYTASSFATKSFKEMSDQANGQPQWFQFYMSKDDGINRNIMDEAKANGVKAIVLTADATVGGNRETDKRNGFTFPLGMPIVQAYQSGVGQTMDAVYKSAKQRLSPKDIEFLAEYSGLPVFVKGVQDGEDASVAINSGAGGIWVSNHGGRQIDGGIAAFDALQGVAETVNKRVPVVFDSGVRRGTHVYKALASGADLVAIGRPVVYGLALGGHQGVQNVFNYFQHELELTMQLTGTHNIDEIKRTKLVDNPYGN